MSPRTRTGRAPWMRAGVSCSTARCALGRAARPARAGAGRPGRGRFRCDLLASPAAGRRHGVGSCAGPGRQPCRTWLRPADLSVRRGGRAQVRSPGRPARRTEPRKWLRRFAGFAGHRRPRAHSGRLAADPCRRRRQLPSQAHPSLEAKLDVTCKGPLALLTRYVTAAGIGRASVKAPVRHLRRTPNLRDPERLAELARTCAAQQRTAIPGEAMTARLVREMATEALVVRDRLATTGKELEAIVGTHPKGALVRSLPGMGAVPAVCARQPGSSQPPATPPASARPPPSLPQPASRPCCDGPDTRKRCAEPGAATRTSSAPSAKAPSAPSAAIPTAEPTTTQAARGEASCPGRHRPRTPAHQRPVDRAHP